MKLAWMLLIAVSLGLAPVSLGDETHCYPTGNCYMIHTTELPFEKANITCGNKGSLTSMRNELEKREILQFVTRFQNSSEFWIGLFLPENTCTVKDKDLYGFSWISGGEEAPVMEWDKPPRISCTMKKKCVVLKSRAGSTNSGLGNLTWFWKNDKCSKRLPSICRSSGYVDMSVSQDVATSTDQHTLYTTPSTHHYTEIVPSFSKLNVFCQGFRGNVTFTCTVENVSYSCNDTHCFCGQTKDKGGGFVLTKCQKFTNESCLDQCIKSSNILCACTGQQTPCYAEECTMSTSSSPVSTSTVLHNPSSTSSGSVNDDDNLIEQLVIPLILGLVALGILIMLVWGGVQMCIRKRKPKPTRKKSIAPVEPEASETDSTDHSSSDEGESEDRIEMP